MFLVVSPNYLAFHVFFNFALDRLRSTRLDHDDDEFCRACDSKSTGIGKLSFNMIYSDKISFHHLIFFSRVLPAKTKSITDFQIIISSTVVSAQWLGLVGLYFCYDCFSDSYESVNPL